MRYAVYYREEGKGLEQTLTVDAGSEEEARERVHKLTENGIDIVDVGEW